MDSNDIPRSNILGEAEKIIYGDREKTYGHPSKNLELIASYWSGHINAAKNVNISLTFEDVAVMMVLLKSARLANTPTHKDSQIDICGYTALLERCQKQESDLGVLDTDTFQTTIELHGKKYLLSRDEYVTWLRTSIIPENRRPLN